MLTLKISGGESWDPVTEEFVYSEPIELHLEHSLVAISEWESKWKKAYFGKQKKTIDEFRDYIRCMTLDCNVDQSVYKMLSPKELNIVADYTKDSMSATYLPKQNNEGGSSQKGDTPTSEMIYYWMSCFQLPSEYEKWHINRLMKLINICAIKQEKPKKTSKGATAKNYAALNAARRKASGSKG